MTILIAGSTGLVGSALFQACQSRGFDVVGISRRDVDLTDSEATSKYILNLRPKAVIDAAALVGGIAINNSNPVAFLRTNLKIQDNLMHASFQAGVERFVFLGSSCMYPKNAIQPIKEEYLLSGHLENTNSAYAIAKITGVEMVNAYRRQYGLNWISLIPTNLYGPRDNFNLETSHVLPALLLKFLYAAESKQDVVEIWGTGKPKREFLHVNDLSNAILLALEKYNSDLPLNVGSGSDISIMDLAEKIATITEFHGQILTNPNLPDGMYRKKLDITRIRELGWKPAISLDEGLESTYYWLKKAMESGEARL